MRLRRLLWGLLTALVAGAAAASTLRVWFTDEFFGTQRHQTLGFDTAWGKSLVAVAVIGACGALTGTPFVRRTLVVFNLLLALAGVCTVVAAGATYQPGESTSGWTASDWFWIALAVTICWSVAAAISAYPLVRELAVRVRALAIHAACLLRRDENPPHARMTLAFVAASGSAVFLLIGAFGPWQAAGVASASGLDNTQDGTGVLAAAFMALLGLLSYWRFGSRLALLAVLALAISAGVVSIADLHDINMSDVASGWGLNLDAEASVGLAISSAIRLFHRGRSLHANPRRT